MFVEYGEIWYKKLNTVHFEQNSNLFLAPFHSTSAKIQWDMYFNLGYKAIKPRL